MMESKKGLIVALSGIDCTGKSTQLELLAQLFRKQGRIVEPVWFRPGYSKELDALRSFVRRVRPKALPKSDDPDARQKVFSTPGVSRAWALCAVLDSYFHFVWKMRRARSRGQVVLCDRYLDDALMDLRLRFPSLAIDSWNSVRLLKRLSAKPDAHFLLMIPLEELVRRAAAKNEPFPDSDEVRSRRHQEYTKLAGSGFHIVIDGMQTISAIQEQMRARVLRPAGM